MATLISMIIVLAVIGLIWYLATTYIPMPAPMRTVITVLAVLALCVWLMRFVGPGPLRF